MKKVIKTITTDRELVSVPTLFVSDWHMEDGGEGDKFKQHETEAVKFLWWVARAEYNIVFLGDILELWQVRERQIADYYSAINEVMLDLHVGMNASWVYGNHDYTIRSNFFLYAEKEHITKHVYATHGHQADTFNHGPVGRVIGKVATWFAKWLADDVGIDLFEQKKMQKWGNSPGKLREKGQFGPYDDGPYAQFMWRQTEEHNCCVGIFGHTHKAFLQRGLLAKNVLANCGHWTGKERPFIMIKGDKVMLCKWE